MALTGVPAHIVLGDVFTHVFPHNGFDIVFSAGFIEHFVDRAVVLKRMDDLTVPGGWVVATWPNLLGLNGWIYRHCDPSSRIEHFAFPASEVADVLARMGYEIMYAGPIDGPGFRKPFGGRGRWGRHPVLRRILRAPVVLFNRASRRLNNWLGGLPESNLCSYNQAVFARKKGVSESRA
ncbi:MAG: methyltransferase domain-containing protein [Candidatus Atribacteria bacterium]|nr:methyltransferase domain-containing protein [Candidatus Atribacteria bacterium]